MSVNGQSADLWQVSDGKAVGRPKVFNGTDASNLNAVRFTCDQKVGTLYMGCMCCPTKTALIDRPDANMPVS